MVQADTSPQLDSVRAAYLSAEDLKVAASIIYNAYHDDPIFLEIFQEILTLYLLKIFFCLLLMKV